MAKTTTKTEADKTDLEALAVKLDALAQEATGLGEERVANMIGRAAKSARNADKQRASRQKKFGNIVAALKAKGLTAEEIVAKLAGEEE